LRASLKARGRRALAYLSVVPISLNTVLTCALTTDGDDNEDCNQTGDQRIFDRRHTDSSLRKFRTEA
jgi:hypothetical protein